MKTKQCFDSVFADFVQDAIKADKHHQETGLHATQVEVQDWIKSLTTNPSNKPPVCHK
ncbi:transcriptional regulator [Conchiformibius steedae]|uniref:Transcriptional regulator n=1 Tax=Conchiformibius steedae TaxID=153493 RepID=A0A3P2A5A5_9NEIS|nr:transcriptional regulator [Conchiformibius steedae]RRD88843.1 transcriptional regulator [Conchiformibius steedae]